MPRALKSVSPAPNPSSASSRPDQAALLKLAESDQTLPPARIPTTGSEIVNVRLSSALVDELDAKAEAESTTRKVIITRALAQAGYHVPAQDLEDRTPRRRRRAG
jgi:hypothetical protein